MITGYKWFALCAVRGVREGREATEKDSTANAVRVVVGGCTIRREMFPVLLKFSLGFNEPQQIRA